MSIEISEDTKCFSALSFPKKQYICTNTVLVFFPNINKRPAHYSLHPLDIKTGIPLLCTAVSKCNKIHANSRCTKPTTFSVKKFPCGCVGFAQENYAWVGVKTYACGDKPCQNAESWYNTEPFKLEYPSETEKLRMHKRYQEVMDNLTNDMKLTTFTFSPAVIKAPEFLLRPMVFNDDEHQQVYCYGSGHAIPDEKRLEFLKRMAEGRKKKMEKSSSPSPPDPSPVPKKKLQFSTDSEDVVAAKKQFVDEKKPRSRLTLVPVDSASKRPKLVLPTPVRSEFVEDSAEDTISEEDEDDKDGFTHYLFRCTKLHTLQKFHLKAIHYGLKELAMVQKEMAVLQQEMEDLRKKSAGLTK